MGFKGRAKKMAEQAQAMAEQAQAKLDEQQTKFNHGQQGGSAPPAAPAVTYDQHGRPMPAAPAGPPSPPSAPLEPVARDEYAPPKLSGGDPLSH